MLTSGDCPEECFRPSSQHKKKSRQPHVSIFQPCDFLRYFPILHFRRPEDTCEWWVVKTWNLSYMCQYMRRPVNGVWTDFGQKLSRSAYTPTVRYLDISPSIDEFPIRDNFVSNYRRTVAMSPIDINATGRRGDKCACPVRRSPRFVGGCGEMEGSFNWNRQAAKSAAKSLWSREVWCDRDITAVIVLHPRIPRRIFFPPYLIR